MKFSAIHNPMIERIFAGGVIFSIAILTSVVIWLNRAGFINRFDYHYTRYFYDHSHWSVPASQRKMGDALLYQIAGYELVTKQSFTEINPEAPPLGKYLLGWSILVTGSALWVNVPLYILLLIFCYLVSREVIKKSWQRWLSVGLIAWQPLIWQQLPQSMLDLGQVTWLMGWLWSVLQLIKSSTNRRRFLASIGTGVFLGLFISTKIAFFIAPLLLLVGGWLIYLKKTRWLILSLIIAGIVYTGMYLPHLFSSDLKSVIGLQKWILNYWLSSTSRPIYGITILSLTTGWYLGHWQQANWTWLKIWNPTWLLGTWSLAWATGRWLLSGKKVGKTQTTLLLCLAALIISLSLVPLFDRYLVIIVPILCLSFVWMLSVWESKWTNWLIVIVGAWTVGQTGLLLPPSLTESAKEIARVAAVPAYQDLWSFVDGDTQANYSRDEFWQILATARSEAQLKQVTWQIELPPSAHNWMTQVPVTVKIKQRTALGDLSFETSTQLKRAGGKWFLVWRPDLFLPEWRPGYKLEPRLQFSDGQVIGISGELLTGDNTTAALYITPSQIQDELTLNTQVEQLTGISKPDQELIYKVDQLPELPQLAGPLLPNTKIPAKHQLEPGISIESVSGRVYHPKIQQDPAEVNTKSALLTQPTAELRVTDPTRPDWSKVLLMVNPYRGHDLILTTNLLSI